MVKKVLFVDDEPIIIRGLKKLIKWNKMGYDIVGEASSGIEGINLAEKLEPDIIITDMAMPEMDGLAFIRKLKSIKCRSKIIILSGYDEFDYARQALKFDVFDYLLKPVTREKLSDSINKASLELDREREENLRIKRLKEQLRESLPLFKEQFILDVLKGKFESEKDIEKRSQLLDMSILNSKFAVIALDVSGTYLKSITSNSDKIDKSELILIMEAKNIVKVSVGIESSRYITVEGDVIYVLLVENSAFTAGNLIETAGEISKSLEKYLKAKVTIGVGRLYKNLMDIKKSYEESNTALKYRLYKDTGDIIYINDVTAGNGEAEYPIELEKDIIESLKYGGIREPNIKAQHLIDRFICSSGNRIEKVCEYCIEFVIQIRRALNIDKYSSKSFLENTEELIRQINRCKSAKSLQQLVSEILKESDRLYANKKEKKEHDVIHQVKQYILGHYSDDVNLSKAAEKVYMSPQYLSSLFKSKTGENFNEYLTRIRMEAAAKMIVSGEYRVFEVADKTGYKNPRYFSEAFKRHHGASPSEYSE